MDYSMYATTAGGYTFAPAPPPSLNTVGNYNGYMQDQKGEVLIGEYPIINPQLPKGSNEGYQSTNSVATNNYAFSYPQYHYPPRYYNGYYINNNGHVPDGYYLNNTIKNNNKRRQYKKVPYNPSASTSTSATLVGFDVAPAVALIQPQGDSLSVIAPQVDGETGTTSNFGLGSGVNSISGHPNPSVLAQPIQQAHFQLEPQPTRSQQQSSEQIQALRDYVQHQHFHKQRQAPYFNSPHDKALPSLMNEYLYNHKPHSPPKYHLQSKQILEQVLKSYLCDFWRHRYEKEQQEKRLWEEITNNTQFSPCTGSWWYDDGTHRATSGAVSTSDNVNGSLIENSNDALGIDDMDADYTVWGTNRDFKTRWQYFAEQLFCLVMRMNSFSHQHHMEKLLKIARNDEELIKIIGNYVSTVSK